MRPSLIVLVPLLLCATLAHAAPPLVDDLVAALNSKDRATLVAFAEKRATGDRPAADRAARLLGLAEQGAPFAVVRVLPERPGEVRAVLRDKNGEELGLRVDLAPGAESRFRGLMVAPVEEIDAPPPRDHSGWKELGGLVEAIRQGSGAPAMTVAVRRGGKLEQATKGVRVDGGKDAVGADEPWSIGSIGKPLCATVVARLIEQGKLDWGTTLGVALAGLPMRDDYKAITLEQLMHHRGGVPAWPGMRRDEVERLAGGETDRRALRERFAREILGRPLEARPGTAFIYSNAGYALLGVAAERAAGKPYEQLVRELVFKPLGLQHSYTAADTLPAARPSGHRRGPDGLQVANFSGPLEAFFAPAGGGLYMSAADLVAFGVAHLAGLRGKDGLLRAATVKRLHQGESEGGPEGRRYAAGWGIQRHPGVAEMHTHNGSNGTMRAQLAIVPDADLVVASFVNSGGETEPSPPLQAVLAIARRFAPSR